MDFLSKITMPEKITITVMVTIVIGIFGGRLFMRFLYNIFLRYFDNIEKTMADIKCDIRELYRRTDNHKSVEDTVEYCEKKNKKKR